jgi:hypothetical protein
MSSLDENQVIDLTSDSLGGILAAHLKFKERHHLTSTAETAVQLNRIKERRQLNFADAAAAPQVKTFKANTVRKLQSTFSTSIAATTITACLNDQNDQMGKLVSQVRPVDDVEQVLAADANRIGLAFKSRFRNRSEHVELEEIVVQTASSSIPLQEQAKSASSECHQIVLSAGAPLTSGCHEQLRMDVVMRESDSHTANAVSAMNMNCSFDQQPQNNTMQLATPFNDADTESKGR